MNPALRRLLGLLLLAGALVLGGPMAQAHPHVWITATSELLYAPDGSITGVRHAWTFDDMFSTYALQGLETKTKGVYSREELAPLAQTNVESLKEYGFFTFAKADGKKAKFQEPVDYFLEYKDGRLTLHFTLPLKTPVKPRELALDVFDPDFFIDFNFADKDPVKLVGAPGRLPDDVPAAERRHRERPEARRADFHRAATIRISARCSPTRSRWSARERSDPVLVWRAAWRSALRCVLVVLMLDGAAHVLMAQTPFGGPRPSGAEPPAGGIVGWLLAKQSEFYRQMSSTIRAAKSDGSAVWTLLAISFAYGIFHAAGPGHGKAVISSYLVANRETARRGIVLSFASALMQSLVAVVIVAVCAWLLNATAKTMCGAEKVIEIASYALIAAFGARLVWTKGGGFIRALRAPQLVPAMAVGASIMIITATIMTMIITHAHTHASMAHDHGMTRLTIMTTAMTMSMTSIAAIPMVPTRANSPAPAAGGAASARSSPSASGPVRARSWFWCSRWRRACSGRASPRPS